MITMKEIAKITGHNASTVSRALNNSNLVKKETRLLIQEVAKSHNYLPDIQARSLIMGKSKLIGVIIPELVSNYFADIISGIESVLATEGYSILIAKSGFEEEGIIENFNTLISRRVDGMIIESGAFAFDPFVLSHHNVPIVYTGVNRDVIKQDMDAILSADTSDSYIFTDNNAFDDIAEYLTGLGHRRIGFLSDNLTSHRLKSLRRSISMQGLDLPDHYAAVGAERYERGGYLQMQKLLSLKQPPTAVMAGTDNLAIGAVRAAKEHDLRIPEDISIIGYDNLTFGDYLYPSLTSVDQFTRRIGEAAAESLLRGIHAEKRNGEIHVISTGLVVKESTGPVRKAGG